MGDTGSNKSVRTLSLRVFIFCLALLRSPVQGEHRLIVSSRLVSAAPGDDVLLPCRLEPQLDLQGRTVEWSRIQEALGPRTYVHLYRNGREMRQIMTPSYVGRTSLSQDGLGRGDVSLTIRAVSTDDSGTFRCFIPYLNQAASVRLVVDPIFVRTQTTGTPRPPGDVSTPRPGDETLPDGLRSRLPVWISCAALVFVVALSAAGAGLVRNRRGNQEEKLNCEAGGRVSSETCCAGCCSRRWPDLVCRAFTTSWRKHDPATSDGDALSSDGALTTSALLDRPSGHV
ncbi:uncharacterized protein LOC133420302 [Cololabis saira]|uniref:uncharacterized protein LOC133420302 n=1 Tax=Cololabis saira TaxID=129043 RepID=UPI002AD44688|nr:uncharacterized protein LOC133420302 [Cololabis saira]